MSFAKLSNYRQSPRKVRLIADAIRGISVQNADATLQHLNQRAAVAVRKVLKSAEANAVHNFNADKNDLFVSEIRVDEGVTLKRFRPRARGRAFPIRKRTSHIMIRLAGAGVEVAEMREATTEEKAEAKKVTTKKSAAKKETKKAEKKPAAKKTAKKPVAKKPAAKEPAKKTVKATK